MVASKITTSALLALSDPHMRHFFFFFTVEHEVEALGENHDALHAYMPPQACYPMCSWAQNW